MYEKLRKIGLTEYEVKIYSTLLTQGPITGTNASKLSNVPHGRTYEILLKLADRGFISVLPLKPKMFKAIEPKIAIENYINNKINDLSELGKEVVEDLSRIRVEKKEKTEEKITTIKGKRNERALSAYSYDTARNYIKSMSTYEFVSIRAREEARKKGIKFNFIATKLTKNAKELIKEDFKKNIQIKYYPLEELRLKIIDGDKSIITVANPVDPEDRMALLIESKELTKALEHYFDLIWKKAKIIKLQ